METLQSLVGRVVGHICLPQKFMVSPMPNILETYIDSSSSNLLKTFVDINIVHMACVAKVLLYNLGAFVTKEMKQEGRATQVDLNIIAHTKCY